MAFRCGPRNGGSPSTAARASPGWPGAGGVTDTSPRLPPELIHLIEGLALRTPPPTVALVHRQVRDVALRNGWPVPNYQRVYRIVKHLDPALVTLAHAGSKTYRTTYDLLYRHEAAKPNGCSPKTDTSPVH